MLAQGSAVPSYITLSGGIGQTTRVHCTEHSLITGQPLDRITSPLRYLYTGQFKYQTAISLQSSA